MATNITLNITATNKDSYRKQLIEEFLNEQPGTINSITEYYYFVETLQYNNRIYLKRPTALNKGVDFEVRVENTQFRYGKHDNIISTGNRPSHDDIANDLIHKKTENPTEFFRLKELLDKTYTCEQINNSDKYQNEITIDETIKDGLKNTETTQHEEFVLNDDEITELFEDFNDLFNLSDKRDRIGQYLLNRHLIETFPESKILAPNPTILEKIMKEFGDNLDQATIQLCKYEDYCNLSESEKSSILDILKIYNYNDENDKVVLKYIIENDYINKDTSIVIERGNTTQERTICDSAKQGLFNKYKFPNSMKFFEKFELALPLDAPFRHAPGVKKINDALELKISGHDDRLVSENGDYRFNKFDPTGFHS